MGYNTTFHGDLKFTCPMDATRLAYLETFFGMDCRKNPAWEKYGELTWMNLELTPNKDGIRWNGDEKSYSMVDKINLIIGEMRQNWPEFGLSGCMEAQGEEMGDLWVVEMNTNTGMAEEKQVPKLGEAINCPHCGTSFKLQAI